MTITNIGRPEFRLLSEEIVKELKALGDKHGLDFSIDGGQLTGAGCKMKLGVEVRPVAGAISAAQRMFEMMAPRYGVPKDAFGQIFFSRNVAYRISGMNPNAPKYPFLGERVSDGTAFKFQTSAVIAGLPKAKAAA